INSNINRKKVSYALLPVWILKTKWENKDYIFAMNGQTGKLVGDLPVSKSKYWLFTLLLTIPAAALFYFLRIGDIISAFLGL
ncbi:MAG: hypothetical protein HUJ75_00920, partial [Parasporobacterium sp.]|nr:hypothetical protein [Parasporobacterium sp.]